MSRHDLCSNLGVFVWRCGDQEGLFDKPGSYDDLGVADSLAPTAGIFPGALEAVEFALGPDSRVASQTEVEAMYAAMVDSLLPLA